MICLMAFAFIFAAEAKETATDVRRIIHKVNTTWQKEHPAGGTAFWHNAAYHTGNMEAYFLTGNEDFLDYSTRWADANQWKGAKSNNRANWKYNYDETDEHVLFGDWQICFQTYVDLYNILPEDNRIKRAREVMEYEMSTPQNDYWWWADGLYMVMPVMTKLYKITGNRQYLNKLYEYVTVSDSIMYDVETGLYFRDGKYVYPKHSTPSGKKDFWARGNGWVLAGLAKVLKDLPQDYAYRKFFEDKFVKLANGIITLQQPEGYWTRSMADPDFAPGYETSGTAFFTYGLLWGVNNGLLKDDKYLNATQKGWKYLRDIALQKDGSIGYVQPIGEKAIPGQVVDCKSTADFGVGAFLLAACEYVRFLKKDGNADRAYWTDLAYKIAYPVLSEMSQGTLKKDMKVEVSPNRDGRDQNVTYMGTFGRLMAGIAPWLALPNGNTSQKQPPTGLRKKSGVPSRSPKIIIGTIKYVLTNCSDK